MEVNTKNFRQICSVPLSECITSIALCSEYLAVGCLDDNLYMWNTQFSNFKKEPFFTRNGNSMGIVDLKFNKKYTELAVSCMDSTIKIWDTATYESSSIQCQIMENWKIQYIDNSIVTSGDLGRINFYDSTSKEKIKKIEVEEIFLTAMTKSNNENFLAVANNSGNVFIINLQNKDKVASLMPHFKIVRSLSFLQDSSKLLTGSDDNCIKMIDISSEKVVSILEGHKQAVSNVFAHPSDNKLAFSCSFDKTIKIWDLRLKNCVGTAITGSPLWDCKVLGKNLITGGENGVLSIYSIQ